MQGKASNGFVADGHERAQEGIRAQLKAEYTQLLKKVTGAQAARLKLEMQLEIEDRSRRLAKADSLY